MIRVDNFMPSFVAQILAKACCKKIFLHCELADLGMKLLDPSFIALLGLPGLAGKFEQNVFPGQGIQGDTGLKFGGELPS